MSCRIATWNVNSIKSRLPHLLDWLQETKPDVALLQEIKTEEQGFPFEPIEDLGYHIEVSGQKTYNGVAILSKYPIEDVQTSLPLPPSCPQDQARYIEAVIAGPSIFRVASVYVPNGQSVESEKFAYKLAFLDAMRHHSQNLLSYGEKLVLGGDWNVAPDILDVYAPDQLEGSICYHPDERARLRALHYEGLHDAYRLTAPYEQAYSWWDYRAGAWQQNKGMRIDHLLISSQAADCLESVIMEHQWRAKPKASDHIPVVASFV